ncbi:hypothetical protein Leryth_019213 [Lithospermum erythrorhizon]|nr:hypothetical protein Leryth_019213 [Lithospermum erythrorhizon]
MILIANTLVVVLICFLAAWIYKAFIPPPPNLCGSPGGPPITGPRIKLRDGRHLSYKEHGVPKDKAKYKIVFVHGFSSHKHELFLESSELVQELGVYIVSFDRAGYGESDPDPKRSIKSTAFDIENLADELGLGHKFYVIGFSMGGMETWGCLKYIPHRLAGVTLIAPVINYYWPGFPSKLAGELYSQQLLQDQWFVRVAYYAPWLVYWWNTQNWFPSSSVMSNKGIANFSAQDLKIIFTKLSRSTIPKTYSTQQGVYVSHHRATMVAFGKWEFDPMDLENPFAKGEGEVHLWHGNEDGIVPIKLQRYIAKKLPWIHYHEVPNGGHLFPHGEDNVRDTILKTLLIGEN